MNDQALSTALQKADPEPYRFPHVMIDIETLGTTPGCLVVSIGAIAFDPLKYQWDDQGFYTVIDIGFPPRTNSAAMRRLANRVEVDTSTLLWWLKQSDDARKVFKEMEDHGVPAQRACVDFDDYVGATCVPHDKVKIWSHGAGFDVPIMKALYDREMVQWGFRHWHERDTRTLFELTGIFPDRAKGIYHNALHDAKNQALAVLQSYKAIREMAAAANAWNQARQGGGVA